MTDDELIERLRRTLQSEASAITLRPPGEPATSYPAGDAPPRWRGRWPLTVAAAAVAAAVGLTIAFWPGGGSSHLGIVAPSPSTSAPAPTSSTALPTTQAPPATPATPITVAPVVVPSTAAAPTRPPSVATPVPPPAPVPTGFAPLSVTFVSPDQGWVAGVAPCSSGSCLTLAHTRDGGQTWKLAPAPALSLPNDTATGSALSVRFANASDGWVYTRQPVSLWSTHDGGASWHHVAIPALTARAAIMAMEASAGRIQVAIIPDGSSTIHLETSSVSSDHFVDSNTGVVVGAGPVPVTQLVLQQAQGWLLQNDRTVVGGARLNGTATWASWVPPCQTADGPAALAASTPTDLVAVCVEGEWGPARNLPTGSRTPSTWLFRSSNGGASFQPVGSLPGRIDAAHVASPAPSTVVVGGAAPDLTASFDGGHTWQAVYRDSGVQAWSYLGFTTLTQGVAIGSGPGGSSVLAMTRDGGHSWAAVSF